MHYFRSKNKLNENKAFIILWDTMMHKKHKKYNEKVVPQYVELTNQLSFQARFPKSGPTYRKQVVNTRYQTLHGQSITKPGTPLSKIPKENLNMT